MKAEVVGLYTADDPSDVFWTGMPCLTRACQASTGDRPALSYWQTAGLVGPESLSRLGAWGERAEDFWRLPVDTGLLRADWLPETRKAVAAFVAGPTAAALAAGTGRPDLLISSGLPDLFEQVQARQSAVAPLTAVGPAGTAGVAASVLCLAAALAADRRAGELRLLLARGASRTGVLRRLLGEGAVTVLPAASAAALLAFRLLPTPRWTAALLAALAAGLIALLAFPIRAAFLLTGPRGRGGTRRRLVAELAVLAATAAAVAEVRRRGVAPAGAGVDPLLVAAPLLLALAGALLLARLQPLLVGALARAAGRRPGAVGFLGLARAARGTGGRSRPSVLPLLGLMLAVTTAGFGATVLDAVDAARLRVARLAVGGDASVTAPPDTALPAALMTAAAALPGVRSASAVWTDDDASVIGADDGQSQATVVVADPVAYAKLARAVGRGRFDPAVLSGDGGPDAPVRALVSRDLADRLASGTFRLILSGAGELHASAVGVVDGTPAVLGASTSAIVLPEGPATARLPDMGHPNRWFATGDIDDARLRALAGGMPPPSASPGTAASPYLVRTSAAEAAELGSDPLQRSADRLFWAAVIGAAGFALLSVLLTLLRAAPERAALLARLRTMGLRRRQGLALILTEALPQALAAAAGGGLVAAATVALLGPAVDLSSMVGAPVPTGLRPAALPVLIQTLGLAALVSVGVLAESAISGRRQITTELRAGDDR